MKKVTLLLLIVVLLAACGPTPEDYQQPELGAGCTEIGRPYYTLWRCIDKEAGVVCWVTGESVSCLLLEETDLEGWKE